MNFKRPKSEVISHAHYAADSALSDAFHNVKYGYMNNNTTSNLDQIQQGISMAIYRAIQSIVHDLYTDEEFEQDLGLKP